MCFSKPKTPDLPPAPAPLPDVVDTTNTNSKEATQAKTNLQKRVALSKGRQSTILTGSLGLQDDANVKKTTLLGKA